MKIFTLIIGVATFLFTTPSLGQDSTTTSDSRPLVYQINLNQEIMPAAWRLIKESVAAAEQANADYILVRLNTYGGRLDVADSIRTRLLNAKPTTIAYIDKNAASAGALISIACDSIYMVTGATIGAATVVDQEGTQMPDKYQSYMRGMMRATAEAQGRDPEIAEGMVDDRVDIEGVTDEGKVITFTVKEAVQHGFCDGEYNSIDEVLKAASITNYTLTEHKLSAVDKIIQFLLNPAVSSLLLMLIIGGIYFELQSPGIGFPLMAAVVGAVLFFAPHYLEGLAENWEILVFVLGIGLIALEIFVIPGFGIAGVMGVAMVIGGLTLSLLNNTRFDFSFTGIDDVAMALFRVAVSILGSILLLAIFGKNLVRSSLFKKLALQSTQPSEAGYTVSTEKVSSLVGKEGHAVTPLHPAGKVEVDGTRYQAESRGEYIESGTSVKVIKQEANHVIVTAS